MIACAQEIEKRAEAEAIDRFDNAFPEGYNDIMLQLYEEVYQSNSQSAKRFGDKSYFVVKDGYMYQYEFPVLSGGQAYRTVYDLIPCPDTNVINTDRQDYIDYTTDDRRYIASDGVRFRTDEDGKQFLNHFDWRMTDQKGNSQALMIRITKLKIPRRRLSITDTIVP